ncbi:PH domain-containing protein [Microbacterium karelineae]|uniref:PH domain-containing protein n=1 Tax=Microbacterium karelineae TaxID=2654283 RepID=UPI001E569EE5|nr:PH domain-containing protein [Microbacterium karelineae]
MSAVPPPGQQPAPAPVLPSGGSSSLADGEWHRLHPLTPLFKGGLVILVVLGIIIANMRDRLIYLAIRIFAPDGAIDDEGVNGDPVTWAVDWTVANNMVLLAGVALLLIVALIVAAYWAVWRFHQFRITDENVEVRKGIVFRSQRRAPLDRVQGVNLTRPFPARLIGMGKLTLEGAGTGADVALEFLATSRAEQVRSDILRLASGARRAKAEAREERAPEGGRREARQRLVGTVSEGVSSMIEGVDQADVVPESVVRIPIARLIGSQAVMAAVWLLFFLVLIGAAVIGPILAFADGPEKWVILVGAGLGSGIPMIFATIAVIWSALQKGFRFSIAPTPDGVRVSSGLLTTITRTIPPGRVHAVEVSQSILWRPFGWWSVRINRMGGTTAAQQSSSQAQNAAVILPVGTRADAERVVALLLPDAPAHDTVFAWEHGILGPQKQDPFTTIPRRGMLWHPLQRRRLGARVTSYALLMRRGRLVRRLGVFPLARLQGVSLRQGPIARLQGLAAFRTHTVPGPISGSVSALDRDDAQRLADLVGRGAVVAAASDHSHRWAEV